MRRIIDLLNASPPYLLSIAAMICFGLIIYFAYLDRLKMAGLLSALFLVCVLLAYFPQLESIKAFTVDVKLRKSLDRAEEILERLKGLAIINARMGYAVLAWENRWGGSSAKQKQALLDEYDKLLSDLKVGSDVRNQMVHPYVQLIGVDFYSVFKHTIEIYLQYKRDKTLAEGSDALEKKRIFVADEDEWRRLNSIGPFENLSDYDLDLYLRRLIPQRLLDNRQLESASNFRKEILNMFDECKRKGGLTPEAADFLDRYKINLKSIDDKAYELFGASPNRPDGEPHPDPVVKGEPSG